MIKFTLKDINSEWELTSKIRKVHEYLFYNSNFNSQIQKYNDEYNEFCAAPHNEEIKELADLYIVAIGITRFENTIGNHLAKYILSDPNYTRDQILEEVVNKMNILQTRIWEEDANGYYQHKVCDNEQTNKVSTTSSKTDKKK
jgi:hypothetical protein